MARGSTQSTFRQANTIERGFLFPSPQILPGLFTDAGIGRAQSRSSMGKHHFRRSPLGGNAFFTEVDCRKAKQRRPAITSSRIDDHPGRTFEAQRHYAIGTSCLAGTYPRNAFSAARYPLSILIRLTSGEKSRESPRSLSGSISTVLKAL